MTRFLLRNAVWIVLLFTTIAFVAVEPRLLSVRIFINVLEHSSILGILVIGMIFCLLAGRFDLSSESTLGFTALVGAWMVSTNPFFGSGWQLPPALVIVLMLGMGAGVGCLNSFFIIKLRVNAFIVTLAMLLALRGFTYVFTNANTMYDLPPSFAALGGYSIGGLLPVSVILFLSLFVVSQFVLSYTASAATSTPSAATAKRRSPPASGSTGGRSPPSSFPVCWARWRPGCWPGGCRR